MERLKKPLRREGAWKSSELLRAMQSLAAEDAVRRGAGQQLLLSKGCTWVLVKNRLSFRRFPRAGEALTLVTWPLKGRFALYPRLFELRGEDGELLMEAESIWAVMDVGSRSMLPGEERGIVMEGLEDSRFRPQRRLSIPEGGERFILTPAPEQIDENGHMNNAAYLDAAEDLLPERLRGRELHALAVDYEHEIPAGRSAEVRILPEEDGCGFEGSMDGRVCFRLREDFAV